MLKRSAALSLAVLMAVVLLAVGCGGGDREQARKYIEKADKMWGELEKELEELNRSSATLITAALSGNFSAITAESTAEISENTKAAESRIGEVIAEYKKVDELKGAGDYRIYAEKMVNALEANVAMVRAGNDLLDRLMPVVKASDRAALEKAIQENMTEITRIQSMQEIAKRLLGEAEEVKREKLGGK